MRTPAAINGGGIGGGEWEIAGGEGRCRGRCGLVRRRGVKVIGRMMTDGNAEDGQAMTVRREQGHCDPKTGQTGTGRRTGRHSGDCKTARMLHEIKLQ